jgi:hypothetical protein
VRRFGLYITRLSAHFAGAFDSKLHKSVGGSYLVTNSAQGDESIVNSVEQVAAAGLKT